MCRLRRGPLTLLTADHDRVRGLFRRVSIAHERGDTGQMRRAGRISAA